MVPDDAFQMRSACGQRSSGSGDVGELEDTAFEVGVITNSGAGWNTFGLGRRSTPHRRSSGQAEDFDGIVQVKASRRTVSVLSADAFHRKLLHRLVVRIDAVA